MSAVTVIVDFEFPITRRNRELEVRFRCDWPTGHVSRDLGEGLLGGEFVVSRAGEAYDARAGGPNPKFRIKRA
jgi:hypothetical protein